MKKLRGRLWVKVFAVMLLCLLALGCAASGLAAAYLYGEGVYSYGYDGAAEELVSELGNQYAKNAGTRYLEGSKEKDFTDTNFRYTVYSPDGEELLSTYEGQDVLWEDTIRVTSPCTVWTEMRTAEPEENLSGESSAEAQITEKSTETPAPTPVPTAAADMSEIYILLDRTSGQRYEFTDRADINAWEQEHSVRVHACVLREMAVQDTFSQRLAVFNRVYSYRALLPWLAAVSFLLGLLVFVFLMSAAGHRDETDTVTPNAIDKIPYDLFTAADGIAVLSMAGVFGSVFSFDLPSLLLCSAAFLLGGLILLLWCMSTATRLKIGGIWKSSLVGRMLQFVLRSFRAMAYGLGKLPLIWQTAAGILIFAAADLFWRLTFQRDGDVLLFGWGLLWLAIGLVSCYSALAFRRLRLGAKKIAAGDESAAVDTKNLVWIFREHAEDLNHIHAGLSRAVDERMKSERLRTELITNVSHDIKTPLTSIINYIDLLEKEAPENEKVREYLDVLSRQSAKLKKLIEDLIEASKASTGNLPVHAEECDLSVLMQQTLGEYLERMQEAELTPVVSNPKEAVVIMADGRHMWRVFDNLLNNICKYAQPGTRVYLEVRREEDKAQAIFRNISREPLNISASELTERFTRGDRSRSTEGNGLGLAIAESLVKLQGGQMELTVDGDLFKATLSFTAAGDKGNMPE